MKLVIMFFAVLTVFLATTGCEKKDPPVVAYVVHDVLDCTESTGGWGGSTGKCRVVFADGTRLTVYRPVSPGDVVKCVGWDQPNTYNCRVQ